VRQQLDDAEPFADARIELLPEADLVDVERLGAVDIRDGDDDELE
jgi:hypothetical protein